MHTHVYEETTDQFLTRQELAHRWKCSEMTIKRRERVGLLNPLRTGRLVRYRLAEVRQFENSED